MPTLDSFPVIVPLVSFILLAMASKQVGRIFSRFGLPHITGFLLTGMIAGPFLLGMMPAGSGDQLHFIDQIAIAVIAFITGSELYLKELQGRLRSILLNAAGIVVAALLLIGMTVFLMAGFVPFAEGFSFNQRLSMAILAATVLLALSPASTIAVMQEVRAKGPFSKTILSVAVVMDVVVIVLFAISTAFAGSLLEGTSMDLSFMLLLVVDIVLALVLGAGLGLIIRGLLAININAILKTAVILLLGWGLYTFAGWVNDTSLGVHIEPVLTAMIAGFFMTNFTSYRKEFEHILNDVSPFVYVAFFTLTGVAIKLDILVATFGIAAMLFLVRVGAIFVGSYFGGTIAGEPEKFKRLAWAGLITQAGIALGLAREISTNFPVTLGDEFATMVISVVVLNEIFGPVLLKFALRRVGEAREAGDRGPDEQRDAVLLGVEGQSLALAQQLMDNHWNVILADTNKDNLEHLRTEGLQVKYIPEVSEEYLAELVSTHTDALVAILESDADNLRACEIAYQQYGVERLVVRVNERSNTPAFEELGVQIVDPTSAMVSLFDQFVRSPHTASLFMHKDPQYDVRQITVTDRDIDNKLLRDLRLPDDVLILEIARNKQTIVPSGHTAIRYGDEVTLVGKPEGLETVTHRFGF